MKKRFWKKTMSVLLCFLLTVVLAVPCFAKEPTKILATYTEELGNGITVVTTITQTVTRSTTSTTKSSNYYSNGQYIGQASLYGSFSYDGSISRATAASGAGSGANGWSYGGQNTWTNGSSAYLSATLSGTGGSVPVNLSLHCDAQGNLS